MKKILFVLATLFLIILFACEDEKSPECKDCWIIVETYDSAGNIESVEEKGKSEYCDSELYDIQSKEPEEIGDKKSYWHCE